MDLKQHLIRQMVFSKATFGLGRRMNGVLDHISKEIEEVKKSNGSPEEWVDIVILALDGLTREIWAGSQYKSCADLVAQEAVMLIIAKQRKNEIRDWPDWRTTDTNKAIEHIRSEKT